MSDHAEAAKAQDGVQAADGGKASETDPPAANQPLVDDDPAPDDAAPETGSVVGEPRPSPVPVAAPHGGQIAPGKPDGEVDTRP
jgi:hypothetical protein